jgi:predicted esterase
VIAKRPLHDRALHANAPSVDDPDLPQTATGSRLDVIGDDSLHVARAEGVQVEQTVDRELDRAVREVIRHGVSARLRYGHRGEGYHHRIPESPLDRRVAVTVHGRYLLEMPTSVPCRGLLVGFHGYAETADDQLARLRGIPGVASWAVASVQGLHMFYRGRTEQVVSGWMTRFDRERAIETNIGFVNAVLHDIARNVAFARPVFAGFSQGVAMAFRAALRGAHRAAGIIALGGDVPPDLEGVPLERWRGLHVLLGRGASDVWYTESVMARDVAWLRSLPLDLRPLVLDAGHEWTDDFAKAAGELLLQAV